MFCVNPLVGIPVAQALLGQDEDHITEAAEDGLLVAWNIGLGVGRREIRILYPSLVWFATLQNTFPADPNTIAESLFAPEVLIYNGDTATDLRLRVLAHRRSRALRTPETFPRRGDAPGRWRGWQDRAAILR